MKRSTIGRPGRRSLLAGAAALAAGACGALAPSAFAQGAYPARPVTIIVPWGPGGSGDITARTFAKYFEKRTGQPAVIENRPGANGIIGSQHVKAASPDGYTVMMTSNMTHGANVTLYKKLPYDPQRDFQHVGMFGVFGLIALVPPTSPFKTLDEFAAYAKAHPDEVSIGHFNASTQVSVAVLKAMSGLPVKDVGYKTIGSAMTDVMGGHIQMVFADYPAAYAHVSSGKLVPLAVTAAQRWADLPQVPAFAERYPGYDVITSLSLAAPAGTPQPVVERLNGLIIDALADPEVKAQYLKLGYTLRPYSAEQTRSFLASESDKWAGYIRTAKIEAQ